MQKTTVVADPHFGCGGYRSIAVDRGTGKKRHGWARTMFDDAQRLRDNPRLFELLSLYAKLGAADRHVWQDRLMQMDGIESKELSRFHGELIVSDWIEQNTGQVAPVKDGVVTACYRITLNGLREIQRIQGVEIAVAVSETPEKPRYSFPRKKKSQQQSDSVDGEPVPPVNSVEVPPADVADATEKPRSKSPRKRKRKSEPVGVEAIEPAMAAELEPALAE